MGNGVVSCPLSRQPLQDGGGSGFSGLHGHDGVVVVVVGAAGGWLTGGGVAVLAGGGGGAIVVVVLGAALSVELVTSCCLASLDVGVPDVDGAVELVLVIDVWIGGLSGCAGEFRPCKTTPSRTPVSAEPARAAPHVAHSTRTAALLAVSPKQVR
jgi:hypothetical protein